MSDKRQRAKARAQELDEKIQHHSNELASALIEMRETNGHILLGYPSFRQYCLARVRSSISKVYEIIKVQEVIEDLNLSTIADNIHFSVLRPLHKHDAEMRRIVWRLALEIAYESQRNIPTAQEVKLASERIVDLLNTGAFTDDNGNQYSAVDLLANEGRAGLFQHLAGSGKRTYVLRKTPVSDVTWDEFRAWKDTPNTYVSVFTEATIDSLKERV